MTIQLTPETDPSLVEAPGLMTEAAKPADANAELRAAYDREKERRVAAETELSKRLMSDIGLDPTTGLGKAIAKEYSGDLTVEALGAYARDEYGHKWTGETSDAKVTEITEAQDQADKLTSSAESVTPIDEGTKIQEAESKLIGNEVNPVDARASVALKMEQFVNQAFE